MDSLPRVLEGDGQYRVDEDGAYLRKPCCQQPVEEEGDRFKLGPVIPAIAVSAVSRVCPDRLNRWSP